MNYTEQELEISNKSYTNKDFNTIYPELLDLVKKLTNKWDPTTSNESDPGVVLLKLWAILADKNNYNIDKNVLETFPLSVTQRANAQKLYDMLGYDMHYYKSAVTDVTLWYIGNILSLEDNANNAKVQSLTVPKFTMVTDDSGQNIFTLLENVVFSAKATPFTVKAIQGTIHDYEVNGVSDITLDNLDSEYRLFFTESRIAENGIFIANKGLGTLDYTEWSKVSNLESARLNSKIYKFGVLPNTQACYIQFPQDIGTLIGNGLKIKYIITDGEAGNVQANQLTTFNNEIIPFELTDTSLQEDTLYGEYFETSINADVTIQNVSATSNGADPESLDSAYKNYKKTIGTFNTLVTVEDYEKAIYNLLDDLGQPQVSNVVVSDRTNDINYSTNVITLEGNNIETQLKVDSYFEKVDAYSDPNGENMLQTAYIKKDKMSAFDLGLYILHPMLDIDDTTGYYYNKSFSVTNTYNDIVNQIDGNIINDSQQYYKSAEHDFIETTKNISGDLIIGVNNKHTYNGSLPYIFKNFFKLTGKVITYYKVTEDEAEEIENNIKLALFKKYNARNVVFGEKVQYEDVVKTIENADTRIKTLVLNEPEYELRYMIGNDTSGSYDSSIALPTSLDQTVNNLSSKEFTFALAYTLLLKMILNGHVQLYKFNPDVEFDFGQMNIKKYADISYITTESNIPVTAGGIIPADGSENGSGYAVENNQNIILFAPNFYTSTSLSAYVNYYYNSAEEYKQGVYYKLKHPIYIEYTDENGTIKRPIIPAGKCIKFVDTGDTEATLNMNGLTISKMISIDGGQLEARDMCTLSATQSIEVIDVNQVTFPSIKDPNQKVLYCMWFTNKSEIIDATNKTIAYTLFDTNESQKILENNEYFIYTNADKNELVILGSGTMLVRPKEFTSKLTYTSKLPASTIVEKGQAAVTDSDWYRYPLTPKSVSTEQRSLAIVELQLVTLGSGAGLRAKAMGLSAAISDLNNSKISIETAIQRLTSQNATLNLTKASLESKVTASTELSDQALLEAVQDIVNSSSLDSSATSLRNSFIIWANNGASDYTALRAYYIKYLEDRISIIKDTIDSNASWISKFEYELIELDNNINDLENKINSEQLYITNTPQPIFEPEYCEEYSSEDLEANTWIRLDDYQIDSTDEIFGIDYYKGWSVMSRFNTMVGSAKAQEIPAGSKLTLYSKDKETGAVDIDTLQEIEGKDNLNLLSNTVLAFGGGEQLQISSSNNKAINIYSYDSVELPKYYSQKGQDTHELKHFSRDTDGYIGIKWADWIRYKNGENYLYSTSDLARGTATASNLSRDFNISFKSGFSSIVAITLFGDNTKAEIKVLGSESSQNISLNKNKKTVYIDLPKSTTGIRIVNFSYDGETDVDDPSQIYDILRIGYPKLFDSDELDSREYSPQIMSTLNYLSSFGDLNATDGSTPYKISTSDLEDRIKQDYPEFDLTYVINPEDAIDGEATTTVNHNNLFAGDLIWDKNHICNKYTIPQYDFENSSVKVAQVYIKK